MQKKITRPADLLIRQSIKDTQYNMYVVRTDADFLDGFQIVPNTNIFGIHKGDQKFLNFKRILHKLENRLLFQFYLFAIISFQISSSEKGLLCGNDGTERSRYGLASLPPVRR